MKIEFTDQQREIQSTFRTFVDREIFPYANQFDQEEKLPAALIANMAKEGYLGAVIPPERGGVGMDMVTFGLLNEEVGRGCSSARSLLTVHSMVSAAILRWGRPHQKDYWLPRLASGEALGAFALTEPDAGSDAKSIQTKAIESDGGYRLTGKKKWITFGQIANLFLIFARYGDSHKAFLVESTTPGLEVHPIHGMLGTRASMLAEIHLNDCLVPKENMLGGSGFGFSAVALSALDMGRYSVATGCVGIGQACLDACIKYTSERKQFDVPLREHQLISEMIANMVVNVKAARWLCYRAGYLKDIKDGSATNETLVAKYFASTMVFKVASDAVQIHGANGCSSEYRVQRYLRDAKIMEIIEGSSQMQQLLISKNAYVGG